MNNFFEDYRDMMKSLGKFVVFLVVIVIGFIILYVIGSLVFTLLQVGFYIFFGIAAVLFVGLIGIVLTMGKHIIELLDK